MAAYGDKVIKCVGLRIPGPHAAGALGGEEAGD